MIGGLGGGGGGGAVDALAKLLAILADPQAAQKRIAELRELEARDAAVAERERVVAEREKAAEAALAAIPAEVERRVREKWAPIAAVIARGAEGAASG